MGNQNTNPVKKLDLKRIFGTFDRTNPEDMIKLTTLIQEKAAVNKEYANYAVWNIDDDYAWIAPSDYSLEDTDGGSLTGIDVSQGLERGAQSRTVKDFENKHRGMFVTEFMRNPSQPAKVYVRMEPLDEGTLFARQQFAAALNVDPWMIRVMKTTEGGWKIKLDRSIPYRESKYGKALQEAVETVGKEGWFFRADAASGVIMVYPGNPPTFPPTIPYPSNVVPNLKNIPFGMKLPDAGRETGDVLSVNFKTGPGILVAAATNNGKSVVINNIIAGALMAGAELVVCNTLSKSVDFECWRDWVVKWGCDSPEAAAASLKWIMNECDRRSAIIREHKVENWWGLPEDVRRDMPFIFLACDELAQWAGSVTIPKADKNSPVRIAKEYDATIHAVCQDLILKIVQTARSNGVGFLFAAQSVRLQDGLDPGVRTNLTTVISPGRRLDETIEKLLGGKALLPKYPGYIKKPNSIGVGYTCVSGDFPCIYKGFYGEADGKSHSQILSEKVRQVRPVEHDENRGRWSWRDILALVPEAAGKPDDGTMGDGMADDDSFPTDGFGVDGRDVADADAPLKGAAAAAHASKLTALEQARAIARQSAEKGM